MNVQKPLLLRNHQFGLLWVGQVFSQAGTRIYQIATLWWLLAQNPGHAGTAMGFFMVLCAIPAVAFLKKIGQTIDGTSSKKVLVTADILATVTTFLLVISIHFRLYVNGMIFITGFLLSLFQAFIDPTLNKAIPELTSAEDTEGGVAFIASTQSLANFGGALLGAIFIGQFGIKGAVILNGVSFAVSALANLLIHFDKKTTLQTVEPSVKATSEITVTGGLEVVTETVSQVGMEIKESIAQGELNASQGLFEGRLFLRSILITFGLVNFFSTPLFIIMPAYTQLIFHLGANWLAGFEACLWLGLVVGTFSGGLVRAQTNIVRLGSYLLAACGVCLALPGLFVNPWCYPVFLFVAAWAVGLNNVKFVTLFQKIVEDKIKGRFFATLGALVGFMFPVSYFVFGLLIDRVPLTTLSLIQGSGVFALAFWLFVKSDTPLVNPGIPFTGES